MLSMNLEIFSNMQPLKVGWGHVTNISILQSPYVLHTQAQLSPRYLNLNNVHDSAIFYLFMGSFINIYTTAFLENPIQVLYWVVSSSYLDQYGHFLAFFITLIFFSHHFCGFINNNHHNFQLVEFSNELLFTISNQYKVTCMIGRP